MNPIIVLFSIYISIISANLPGPPPENYYDVAIGGQPPEQPPEEWGQVCALLNQLSRTSPNFVSILQETMNDPNEVGQPVVDHIDCEPQSSTPGQPQVQDRQLEKLSREIDKLLKTFVRNKLALTSLGRDSEAALASMTRMAMEVGTCTPMPSNRQGREFQGTSSSFTSSTPVMRFPSENVLQDQIQTTERLLREYRTLFFDFLLNKSEIDEDLRNIQEGHENVDHNAIVVQNGARDLLYL
ncbi:hypothetical protein QAD02_009006 [Eretmocerus hayati]|uniref:Uncharacterized protein n=1 Tax=Eretmocerus hayati TaxID=131215 RepID=A0ACC2N813_9HYME|nr:hypothetical protein QAD02_009006 [Eretmocerus hayati]